MPKQKRKTEKIVQPTTTAIMKKEKSALEMTAREYFTTPEGQRYLAEQNMKIQAVMEKLAIDAEPMMRQFSAMAENLSNAMRSSGIMDIAKLADNYSKIIKTSLDWPPRITMLPPPRPAMRSPGPETNNKVELSEEVISKISTQTAQKLLTTLPIMSASGETNVNVFIFNQTDGNLYRRSKSSQCYHLDKMRRQIFEALLGRESFVSTDELRGKTDYVNAGSLREAIRVMNVTARRTFSLGKREDQRFIISHAPSGYMINEEYKVIEISDS